MLLFEHEAFIDEKPERAAGVEYGRHITCIMLAILHHAWTLHDDDDDHHHHHHGGVKYSCVLHM
jgi:hypothetical protein